MATTSLTSNSPFCPTSKLAPPSQSPFGLPTSSGKGTVFGVPNTDFKSTLGFGSPSNASASSSIFGAPSSAFTTGFTTGTSVAFPSTTLGFGKNSNQSNGSATSSIFGARTSPFTTGTSNAFPSTTLGFGKNSNQSNVSATSSIFGAPSSAFTTGFTTGTLNAFPSTTPGFGKNSNQSNASTNSSIFGPSPAFPNGFTTGTSNVFPSTTPGFGNNSTNTSGFLFGIKSSTESQSAMKHKPATGSRFVPYSATRVDKERIQSISGMPDYEAKSHEELRLEDYELKHNSKGDGCDTPVNIFRNPNNNLFGPPIKSTTSTTISTFVPSPSPFPQTSPFNTQPLPAFINQNTTTVPSPNPFSLPKTDPNPSQPQPFVPSPNLFSFPKTNQNPSQPQPFVQSPNPFSFPKTNPNPSQPQPFVQPPNPFSFPKTNPNPSQPQPFVPSPSPFSFPKTNPNPSQPQPFVPSPNPFSFPKTNPNPSQPQPFVPSSTNQNPFSIFPSNVPTNTCNQFPLVNPMAFTNPFPTTISPSTTSIPNTSQPTVKLDFHFPDNPSQPSQAPISSTSAAMVGYPHINVQQQQYVQAKTVGVQSTFVADPFPTRSEIDRPNTVLTIVQHGISSLPPQVPNKLSANRSTSSLRIRHVSPRLNSLPPQQRYTIPSCSERKVAFFNDGVDRPGPFLPRENPRSWVTNSLPSPHSSSDGKCCEDKVLPCSSLVLDTCIQEETEHLTDISISQQTEDEDSVFVAKKYEDDVLALLPKLPNGDEYYTEPSLTELAAKEMDEPGSSSRVNDFVVGKSGYGSIKFLGETDVRHLDLGTIVQFKNREVIVYADEKTKPVVGEGMNKTAEVTLLNVKCVGKKTGKQYVDGPQVESYKEMLMKKGLEQGTEFISYDPVRGEWRFRVQHF